MNLNISSEKIDNPLLIDLLRQLNRSFSKIDSDFFVIGATARDIIVNGLAYTAVRRKTKDLDIAIAVTGWDKYNEICRILVADGFEKSTYQAQRFYFCDYEVDLVPYGSLAKDDDNIYWPPDETIAMSVKGFDEVLSNAVTVSIDNEFEIKIASLHGLFLLKLNAWLDSKRVILGTNKDAEDMWCIIENYYFANEGRGIHLEVYELDEFDITVGGAYWMAHDIADLLSKKQIAYYANVIHQELDQAEDSRLIVQILETNETIRYSDVIRVLQIISDVFINRLTED